MYYLGMLTPEDPLQPARPEVFVARDMAEVDQEWADRHGALIEDLDNLFREIVRQEAWANFEDRVDLACGGWRKQSASRP